MMKEINGTASSAHIILAPFVGEINPESVKGILLHTKYGTDFSAELADAAERDGAVVVVNLAADDKKAEINVYLAEHCREKLLAGVRAAAKAVNAAKILIVKPENVDFPASELGEKARVIDAPRSLVFREESALYHFAETGEVRSCPMEKAFPSEGYKKCPTVMGDAETFCRLYAAACPDYEETKLIVIRKGAEELLLEAKTGTSLGELLSEAGIEAEKQVLVGGVTGEFLTKEELKEAVLTTEAKWDLVILYTQKDCLADATAKLAAQAREESCGKCVLCREGTWHFQSILQDVVSGRAKKDDLAMILDIGPLIRVGAFCSFGQGMARAVVSSVEKNRSELEAHFVKKTCPAGVCRAFAKMVIDPEKCIGCGDCVDVCDEDAIEGKKKFIHIIDADLCENCGKCASVCEEGAIVPQDGSIRQPKKPVKVGKFK